VNLFHREFGTGDPLIILHGLYGSSDNWVSIAHALEAYYRVILVDQRNHGQSPHSNEHNYKLLSSDLKELFDKLCLPKVILIGHSMGRKTAMKFTADYPKRVKSLIVVDIAPWGHLNNLETLNILNEHRKIIEGLSSIPLKDLSSRNQADEILSKWLSQEHIRQFLLKNLKREVDGTFSWKLNLTAISRNIEFLMDGVEFNSTKDKPSIKTLFIKGDQSNYIPQNKVTDLKDFFPDSEIFEISGAGHWVHAEKPKEFITEILRFLKA